MATSEHELDAPPWQRFESTLMATSRSIRRLYDQVLADLGVNLTEGLLVAVVDAEGPLAQAELASRLGLGRAAVGQMVDGLEGRDIVARHPHERDRRIRLVGLTEEGRELAAQIVARDLSLRTDLRRGLARSERAQLARTLLQVQQNIAAVSQQVADDGR